MSLAELAQLHSQLVSANGPEDIFPSLRSERSTAMAAATVNEAVEREYVRLTQIAAPARFAGDSNAQSTARRILARLYELHQQALDAMGIFESVDSDDSRRPVSPAAASPPRESIERGAEENGFAVSTRNGTYRAERLLVEGDLSRVYSGDSDGKPIVVKVAFEPSDNGLLLDEVRSLRLLEVADAPQRKHLPKLIDQFQTPDGRVGTVLGFVSGYTGVAVRERYPKGIPGEHAAWMLARLLSVLGFAHSHGIIHGHVELAHFIISPPDHNVVLIDWSYSVVSPERTGQRFKIYHPDYSAPEVIERKPPIPASDLYSLGKCMISLLGGDLEHNTMPDSVDARLQRFVRELVCESAAQRPQDAWQQHAKLKQLREEIYGPHSFVPFDMSPATT